MTSSFGFELYDKEFKLRLHFEDDYLLNLLGITPSTFVQPIFDMLPCCGLVQNGMGRKNYGEAPNCLPLITIISLGQ